MLLVLRYIPVFGETPRAVRLPIETFGYQYAIGVRFLTDHDVRYVVWSIRESNNIDAKKSIMQAVNADCRWMEFSTTPEAHVGVWSAADGRATASSLSPGRDIN